MDKHVLRRWRNGFGAHIYGQAIVVLIQLVGVPVLLHYWGAQLYGEWLTLSAIPVFLSVSDLGFSQSVANDMTQRVARGDLSGALAVFQSLIALVLGVMLIGCLVGFVVLSTVPIGHWMHFRLLASSEVRWILALLAAEVLVRLVDGAIHAGYRATGDYALHVGINYSTLLAQSVAVWVAVAFGSGPIVAAAVFLAVHLLEAPAAAWLLVHRHPELSYGLARAKRAHLRGLVKPAFANLSMPLAQAFSLQGMVLAVGGTLGPIAVVTFSTLRTLARVAVQGVLTVSHAAEPEMAGAYGSGEHDLFGELYVQALRAGLWLSCTGAIVLALIGGFVLKSWTRGAVAMDVGLFRWLLASAALTAVWYSSLSPLRALNRHVRAASLYVFVTGIAVMLAILLLHTTGRLATAGMALVLIDVAMIAYTVPAATELCMHGSRARAWTALNPLPLLALVRDAGHGE